MRQLQLPTPSGLKVLEALAATGRPRVASPRVSPVVIAHARFPGKTGGGRPPGRRVESKTVAETV